MKIKDLTTGKVFEYGSNVHHALVISDDGRTLSFLNLQNGDGSEYGEYRFVDDNEEVIPGETKIGKQYGADSYFNIGGFEECKKECNKDTNVGYNGWTPCEVELPKKNGEYLCTVEIYSFVTKRILEKKVTLTQFSEGYWCCPRYINVLAWKQKDIPYQKGNL